MNLDMLPTLAALLVCVFATILVSYRQITPIIYLGILFASFFIADQVIADTELGEFCYFIKPPNAPQDNGYEKMWLVERGTPGSGKFDSSGFHQDIHGVRTPMYATSYRYTDAISGAVMYGRVAYGILGNIHGAIHNAIMDDPRAMFLEPKMALFKSISTMIENPDLPGRLVGLFIANVIHHDGDHVVIEHNTKAEAGVIYSIDCATIPEV